MAGSSSAKQLDKVLKLLKAVGAAESDVEMQELVQEATETVVKMQTKLKRMLNHAELVQLVQRGQYEQVTEKLLNNFPAAADREKFIKEVLALSTVEDDDWYGVISWVQHLEANLQPMACETLHRLIKDHSKQLYPTLLLMEHVTKLSIGIKDNVRAELECDCRNSIDSIVEGIKKKDFTAGNELVDKFHILEFYAPNIVRKFDVSKLESVLLLIYYSEEISYQLYYSVSFCIVRNILKTFEENFLLYSEHALHSWAHLLHVRFCILQSFPIPTDLQKLLEEPLEKLNRVKPMLMRHYQRYVENKDKQKIKDLHDQNKHLAHVVPDFVHWYLNGDLKRIQNLSAVIRSGIKGTIVNSILVEMHDKMMQQRRICTFEVFYLFNEFKQHGMLSEMDVPQCLLFLLTCTEQHDLQVVNKFLQGRLCVQHEKPCCFVGTQQNKEKQTCCALVDPDTALTRICFKSRGKVAACWEMEAQPGGVVGIVAKGKGTQWMIKFVDDQHVKIFTEDGQFLTSGHTCLEDQTKRLVCLMKENNSDKQLWKITEPVKII